MTASRPNESESAVAALIETYRQSFLQVDPELLGSIWDREHDPLNYVAMERPEMIKGWPAIKRYYEALPEHLEQMLAKAVDDVRIDVLGDAAAAFSNSIRRSRSGGAKVSTSRPGAPRCCFDMRQTDGV
jgi:hypothetical protein